jgi:alpha-tubulin suppressor-like RCC1 family protein
VFGAGTDHIYKSEVPLQAVGLQNIITARCGGHPSQAPAAMALRSDGAVFTWGSNQAGQLGLGSLEPDAAYTPRQVPGLFDIQAIDIAGFSKVALGKNGLVYTWGWSHRGNLGHNHTDVLAPMGPPPVAFKPDVIPGFSGVRAIAAGHFHMLAIR